LQPINKLVQVFYDKDELTVSLVDQHELQNKLAKEKEEQAEANLRLTIKTRY